MKREIIVTSDGSTTIFLPDWNEQYHSKHGAIQEAKHVFLRAGLDEIFKQDLEIISILEIGFGTGLNCFLTYLENDKTIDYFGVEAYPVFNEEIKKLNYASELKSDNKQHIFKKLHSLPWEEKHQLSDKFSLTKRKQFFHNIDDENTFNLIYFDAFGAEHQPDLWTEEIFKKMFVALKENGILVTYSAKGSVRRAMQTVGFTVERLQGPPGKREMLRARKLITTN